MFTLSRFGVLEEGAKKEFLNKKVAKILEKGLQFFPGVPVFRKLRSVRTHPGSSSTFLEISALPREFHRYRRGLRNLTKGNKVGSEQKESKVSKGFETGCALSTEFTRPDLCSSPLVAGVRRCESPAQRSFSRDLRLRSYCFAL